MIFKVQVPKGTNVEIGKRLPVNHNFNINSFIGYSVVKKIISDTEILLELPEIDIEPGGLINKGSFVITEFSIVNNRIKR